MTAWGGEDDDIRATVDELAEQLGRSVVVNDPLVRQLYGSRHFDDEDPVRVRALLRHDVGAEVIDHVLAQGVAHWPRPGRLAGDPALGLLPRWCAPLRADGTFLGTLMVIDGDATLTEIETGLIADAAAVVAAGLATRAQTADARRAERDRALRGVLSADDRDRRAAAGVLRDEGFPDRSHLVVTVVDVSAPRHSADQVGVALRGVRGPVEGSAMVPGLGLVTDTRAEFVQHRATRSGPQDLHRHATGIRTGLARTLGPEAQVRVGVGAPAPDLAGLRAAHRQATVALRAARRLARLDGVAVWDDLGAYVPLLSLPDDLPPGSPAARALAAVDAHDAGPRLRETLRVYLDAAGSAPRAAKALTLHRTSLYYRLQQIQDITGFDLDSGADRLALHLQLHIDELTGDR